MHEVAGAVSGAPNSAELSRRESEVLGMVATGLTNVQIARRLDVTVHAVKFHLAAIYRKLGVSNRTEAAVRFMQQANSAGGASK